MPSRIYTVIAAVLLLTACAGSKITLTGSAKLTDEAAAEYSKLAVIALTPNNTVRANVEEAIATKFREKGIKAVSTFTMFPLANHMEEVRKNSEMSEEDIKARIRERINFKEIDAILILAVLDTQEEERYVQKGMSMSVAGPSTQYADPVYNYEFTDYYSYSYATIYNPGYYEKSKTFFVESNLYHMEDASLRYSAQFNIKDPEKVGEDSEDLAGILVDDIISKKVVEE